VDTVGAILSCFLGKGVLPLGFAFLEVTLKGFLEAGVFERGVAEATVVTEGGVDGAEVLEDGVERGWTEGAGGEGGDVAFFPFLPLWHLASHLR
jgi:hypothetical protein